MATVSRPTAQHDFARAVTKRGVQLAVYNDGCLGGPSPLDDQVVRGTYTVNGAEYGCEETITWEDATTIGQAIDSVLERLMAKRT